MQYKYTALIALIIVVFLFCQCTEKGSVPGYIKIDQIKVDGENNPGIYDAWIYVNDYLIGVYELPVNVPVIADEEAKITIGAGIKINGLSGNRARYPFYNYYTTILDLSENQSVSLSPSVSYTSWTSFLMRENFEKTDLQLTNTVEDEDDNVDTVLFVSDTVHYIGSMAGVFKLDREKKDTIIEFKTKSYFERPAVENTVGTFLELNYKGTGYLAIGLYVTYLDNVEEIYIVHITPSESWKKVYVDIGSQITQYPEGTPYQVYFYSYLDSKSDEAFGAIDDLRLVQKNSK